ncbi:MAG: hypothetical protein COB12_00575 [Flavobacterium sp.]|nr:MAG: hypothetical protein COB12_00575 [Flavobacterium sp.]
MRKNLFLFILIILLTTTYSIAQVTAFQPTDLMMCGNNNIAIFNLTVTESEIIGAQDPTDLFVNYYETQADADNALNVIVTPTSYVNIANPQVIYARLEDNTNGDYDTTLFVIYVIENPVAIPPTPLETCDDDYDGFAVFDLQSKTLEITGGEPGTGVTYHETEEDSELGINPLVTPHVNNTSFFETLYVRVYSTVSGCLSYTTLDLIVYLPPTTITVSDLTVVDDDGDGFTTFDLTSKETEILNGQANIGVTFYETLQDAINDLNIIVNAATYLNTSNPQTIYYRLINGEQCFTVNIFDLVAVDALIDEEPDDIFVDEGDGDGLAIFDLTVNEAQMLGDQNPAIALFTYHTSFEDSDNGVNAIATPTAYQNVLNPQTIYVRLTNNNTGFYVLTSFVIETDEILGVEDAFISNFKMYPNPSEAIINLKSNSFSETVSISIYNLQGQLVITEEKTPSNETIQIDISNLTIGIYFIKIVSGENTVIKKLIKR